MEPNIVKKDNYQNQKKILVLSILCMVVLLISSSYAIMTNFTQKENAIVFTTGNLEMTILNGEETFELINLNNKLPESDQSGLDTATVIPITLKNTGNITIGIYKVKLIKSTTSGNESTLSEEYIRFSISEDNIAYSSPSTLSTNDNIIYTGKDLEVEATKVIYLKIWASENAGTVVLNNTFFGSLEIELEQKYKIQNPTITNISDAGYGKITFTAVDNGTGVSEYCVNQNQEDTTTCTWYEAVVGSQTTGKIVTENGNYYVHIKDSQGNIGHSDVVVMDVNLTAEIFAREKYGTDTTLVAVNTSGTLYNGSGTIREYRYSGATANNYVIFNDDLDTTVEANELWRIVGIFKDENGNQHFKLLRNTILTNAEIPTNYVKNSITYTVDYGSSNYAYFNKKSSGTNNNDWTTAGLQYWLNTDKDEASTANVGYYAVFSSKAKSLIADMTYYLGNVTVNNSTTTDTTVSAYTNERNQNNITSGNKATWSGKIGLLYPSDYGYSADSSYWSTTTLYTYNSAARNTSWLYKNANHTTYEWLISPTTSGATYVSDFEPNGNVFQYSSSYSTVRPTFYLVSNARLKDATGTSSDPYKVIE